MGGAYNRIQYNVKITYRKQVPPNEVINILSIIDCLILDSNIVF